MRIKAGTPSMPEKTSKSLFGVCLGTGFWTITLLLTHALQLSYKQRSTPHVTWNTCLQKNIITNKAMPLAKTKNMRLQRTMTRKQLCVSSYLTSVPFSLWALEQSSDGTVCSCNSMPQTHFAQRMERSGAHIYPLMFWLPKENLMGSACLWIWTQLIF